MSNHRWCEVDSVVFSLGSITNLNVIKASDKKNFIVKAYINYYEPPTHEYSNEPHNGAHFTFGKRSSEDECKQLIRDVIAGVYDLQIPPLKVKLLQKY